MQSYHLNQEAANSTAEQNSHQLSVFFNVFITISCAVFVGFTFVGVNIIQTRVRCESRSTSQFTRRYQQSAVKTHCRWSNVAERKPHQTEHNKHNHTAALQVTSATVLGSKALLFGMGPSVCAPLTAMRVCAPCNSQGSVAAPDDVLAAVEVLMEGNFA